MMLRNCNSSVPWLTIRKDGAAVPLGASDNRSCTTDQLLGREGAYGSVIWRLTLTVAPLLTVTVAL
jgi:hypothetical protein